MLQEHLGALKNGKLLFEQVKGRQDIGIGAKMLSDDIMEQQRLILMWRFSSQMVQNNLIPEIEKTIEEYGVTYPAAYEIFQKNKYAPNSLYFHHFYAESDIPMGQEYKKIAVMENYQIRADSIQACHAKVLCFITAFKMQPADTAAKGHHELSLIQFEQGVPQIIYDELFELTEPKQIDIPDKTICLMI